MGLLNSEKARYFARVFWYLRLRRKYRERTMIPALAYAENLALVAKALDNTALDNGVIVECGTWRGGMSAGMIEVGGPGRQYYFFDSFEGMPPVEIWMALRPWYGKTTRPDADSVPATPRWPSSKRRFA